MAKEIENSVLERCSPHGNVVHVYIDRRSPYVSGNKANLEPYLIIALWLYTTSWFGTGSSF